MLAAIEDAEISVDLLTFVYWTGPIGQQFAADLDEDSDADLTRSERIDLVPRSGRRVGVSRWGQPGMSGPVKPGAVNRDRRRRRSNMSEALVVVLPKAGCASAFIAGPDADCARGNLSGGRVEAIQ